MSLGIYRTKTYIAADWTGDRDAIDQLHKWNDSNYWSLNFVDVHEFTQSNDSSLNCSIKNSLKKRMDVSKTFVLIVGEHTKDLRSGRCAYCNSYSTYGYGSGQCIRGHFVDNRSYIEYECDKAIEAGIKIVVLYNSAMVNKSKCPEAIRNRGIHVPMCYQKDGELWWDYQTVKQAIMG